MYLKIDNYVYELLTKNGWFAERKINLIPILQDIKKYGFQINEEITAFIENFNGIKIVFNNAKNGLLDDITFDVKRALEIEVIDRVINSYESRVNKKMCLIGTLYREHMVLLIDEQCSLYGGYDDYLVKFGNSPSEAIMSIIHSYTKQEII